MAQYKAFDQGVEVHGKTILTVIDDALARFSEAYRKKAHTALADHGIKNPDPEEWYPQQAWLDTVKTIADDLEPHILDRLGEQLPDVADWPTGITTVEEGLRSIDTAYQENHRGGEVGYYRYTRVDDQTGEVTCKNPYPCLFDRGLIRAVAQRYAPVKAFVFIEERTDQCRRNGATTCTYTVSW